MWDVKTVTAADFTVEWIISETLWNKFLTLEESKSESTPINSFYKFIKYEFERIIYE